MEVNRQPQVSLKAKITVNVEKKYDIQKKVAREILGSSSDISLRTKSPLERLRSHQKRRQEDHELGKNPREEELFPRFLIKRQGFAKSTGKLAEEQGKLTSHSMVEKTEDSEAQEEPQQVSFLNRHPQAVHSLQKHSILHLPTELPPLTSSAVEDDGGEEEASKVIFIQKSGKTSARPRHGKDSVISEQAKEQNTQSEQITENVLKKELESQDSRREDLLRHMIIGGSNSRRPTDEAKTLNERLPEKTSSNGSTLEVSGRNHLCSPVV
ncbi:hypothetical protein NXF25_020189 [Crotalus adamanteus]|uniref:Uncharacterized protein n=1 Tax=Crotalus adamanteus TaxID=8729 RepID=A0AAW1B5R6_CROAD